ncbi:MAG: tRNA pseudouridine(55) synthase TruB [Candidatus Schekmanbacteria bacterium]|nr:MAG: tRNA pseudouridine(55) synthase TruB [Candidatus Schekmanbacteria bacterium]
MDGAINLFKPSGITSFKATEQVKKITGAKKCGHGGTLDPLAEGVLPIFLNKATKIIPFLKNSEKSYVATIRLGIITDTMDSEGRVIEEVRDCEIPSIAKVEEIVKNFEGEIEQKPPVYSAVKYKGHKLYEYARKNIAVDRRARRVKINKIDIVFYEFPFLKINVICSSGTYIRSLADDIGRMLGCGGHISSLLRTRSGMFTLEDTITLEELKKRNGIDTDDKYFKKVDELLSDYKEARIPDTLKRNLLNGLPFSSEDIKGVSDKIKENEYLKVKDSNDKIIAIVQSVSKKSATGSEKNFIFKVKRVFN